MKKLIATMSLTAGFYMGLAEASFVINAFGGILFLFTCIAVGNHLAEKEFKK